MHVYVVMGVSGVGKTSIGIMLAERLGIPFYDADNFHPPENVKKMKAGEPLDDEDRSSWLAQLAKEIKKWSREDGAVLACSALKKRYRDQLKGGNKENLTWVFLHSDFEVILERIRNRKDHYFKSDLLQSQFDILEHPEDAIDVDVNKTREQIVDEIMKKIEKKEQNEIGLLGLGVMGKSLALNLATKGFKTAVFNRQVKDVEVDIAETFAAGNKDIYDFPWFDDLEKFVHSLARPRNILLMVNAGPAVDMVVESLLPFLEEGDLIMDGGNSHYKDTIRRERSLKEKGILFMGIGVSGGEEGALKGPSIMPGGPAESYKRVGKMLEKIAARDKNADPCCTYIGPDGAGHFVKMLHNGIEYGEMQLIAETYHFLRFHHKMEPDEIAGVFEKWNEEMKSYLLEISVDILRKKEGRDFLIDKILDAAGQKGTGGWSTNAALELGVSFDTITAAVMARNISALKEERVKAEEKYEPEKRSGSGSAVENLFSAYRTASIINHAVGFELLRAASREYSWNLDLSEISRIWTNGCIIRSGLMEDLVGVYRKTPMEHLLMQTGMIEKVQEGSRDLSKFVSKALESGFPAPVSSAALNYLYGYTSSQSSANMIQAQRDYFGAHTYERKDKPRGESFHTEWKKKENK